MSNKTELESFRLSEELSNKLNKFADKIEVNRSEAIRLAIEDSINRYTWPGEKNEGYKIFNPDTSKVSKIIAIMRAIQYRKLAELSMSINMNKFNEANDKKQKEIIEDIIKKFV